MLPSELLLLCALLPSSAALPATALIHNYRSLDTSREQQRPLTADVRSSASGQYRYFHEDELKRALSPDQWLPFDEVWRINQPFILSGNGGDTYIEHYIKEAIVEVSAERNLDARVLLAVMMQQASALFIRNTVHMRLT